MSGNVQSPNRELLQLFLDFDAMRTGPGNDCQANVTADVGNDRISLLSASQFDQLVLDLIYAHDSSLVLRP
jgi:hypothetical protein